MNFPTETVNVLPHLNELRETWRNQDFRFTKEQQEQYDMLMEARKERVPGSMKPNVFKLVLKLPRKKRYKRRKIDK